MFNLISNCQTVLQSANAVLYFHEPYLNSSFSPSSPAFTLISLFDLVIPVSVKEVLHCAVFTCNSLMTDDAHLLMCLLEIYMSFVKLLLKSFAH